MLTATMTVVLTRCRLLVNRTGSCYGWRMEVVSGVWRVLRVELEVGVGCWQENTVMRQQCAWCEGAGSPQCGDCRGTGNVAPHGVHDRRCGYCNGTGDVKCWHCDGTGELDVEAELETVVFDALVAEGVIQQRDEA
jgi:hypothetical protein